MTRIERVWVIPAARGDAEVKHSALLLDRFGDVISWPDDASVSVSLVAAHRWDNSTPPGESHGTLVGEVALTVALALPSASVGVEGVSKISIRHPLGPFPSKVQSMSLREIEIALRDFATSETCTLAPHELWELAEALKWRQREIMQALRHNEVP